MIQIFLFSFIGAFYLFSAGIFFFSNKNRGIEQIYVSIIFGAFVLSMIAVFANFFIPINFELNTLIFIIFIIFGFLFIYKNKILKKLVYASILISLVTTLILYFDTIYRPDANLYHLPYTKIINEHKIIIGISNIHFRFGLVSIIQYLNGIFNNYIFEERGVILPAAIIFSSILLYFWTEINNNIKSDKLYCYYIFLIFSYILYGYNRYSEFGNDTIAHLIFLLLSSYFLKSKYIRNIDTKEFFKISILSLFCFMLKTSLVFVFLFPIYFFIKNFKRELLLNPYNIIIFLFIISWFTKNILVSGCLIYPIEITCFENLQWFSNNSDYYISAKTQSLDNEAWTKGWPDYKGVEISQKLFVKNFFWLETWLSINGFLIFKKLSVFIIAIIILNFLLKKIKYQNNFLKFDYNNQLIFLILFSFFASLIWFLRFPLFRYGSSYIVVLIISLSTFWALKQNFFFKSDQKFKKFIKISLVIFLALFVMKHGIRIYKKFDYTLKDPWPQFPKTVDTNNIAIKETIGNEFNFYQLKKNMDGCGYVSSPCTPYPVKNIKFKKAYGYTILYLDK